MLEATVTIIKYLLGIESNNSNLIFLCFLGIVVAFDQIVLAITFKYKKESKNPYFRLHIKQGFVITTIIKALILIISTYYALNPAFHTEKMAGLTILYFIMVLSLMIELIVYAFLPSKTLTES